MHKTKMFIPIKGHSERIPNKNFVDFGGLPLWEFCVSQWQDSFDITIDTDSNRVKSAVKSKYKNVTVIDRDWDLVGDHVSVNKIIDRWLNKLEVPNEEPVIQTHVTNPLVNADIFVEAVQIAKSPNYDSVFSVTQVQARLWRLDERGGFGQVPIPVNHNPYILEPTQRLSPIYIDNSCFYIFSKQSFVKNHNRIGSNPYFYKLEYPYNVDIDDPHDLELARFTYGQIKSD